MPAANTRRDASKLKRERNWVDADAVCRLFKENATYIGLIVIGTLITGWLGLHELGWNDYDIEASVSVHQLLSGHLEGFLMNAPAYGGSLLLRAPFGSAATLFGSTPNDIYILLALPSLLACGWLAFRLLRLMRENGHGLLSQGALFAVLVLNPITVAALRVGHPEEILTGIFCIAAVLSARGGHASWAGIFIGLAIGSKSWALLALLPAIGTLSGGRWRALLLAASIALALSAPFIIVQALHGQTGPGLMVASSGSIFEPQQLWWFFGEARSLLSVSHSSVMSDYRLAPHWVTLLAHPAIVAVSLPLTLLWRRLSIGRSTEPLALLTLLLLLRCLLDPWNNYYYAIPFLFSLAAWEVSVGRRPPAYALLATAMQWLCFRDLPAHHLAPGLEAIVYLSWTLPGTIAIGLWLYRPAVLAKISLGLTSTFSFRRGRLSGKASVVS